MKRVQLHPESWAAEKILAIQEQREWVRILAVAGRVQSRVGEIQEDFQWLNRQIGGVAKFTIQAPQVIDTLLEEETLVRSFLRMRAVKRGRDWQAFIARNQLTADELKMLSNLLKDPEPKEAE